MSLTRIAARICAVEALKGKTLVGDNVLNSHIGALSVSADAGLRTDQQKPFVSVYADGGRGSGDGIRSLYSNGQTEFLFEAGILMSHCERDDETDEAVILEGIPATDDAFEFHLDIVIRQIVDALADPENAWSALFREMAATWQMSERARAAGDNRGTRLAAHQLKITAQLIADPVRGSQLKEQHPLAKFFAKAEAIEDAVVTAQIAVMRAQLEGDETVLQTTLRRYGMSLGEAGAILLAPAGEANAFTGVEVSSSPAGASQ